MLSEGIEKNQWHEIDYVVKRFGFDYLASVFHLLF